MQPIRIAVLISGGGTTLDNLVQEINKGGLLAKIVQVISSNNKAIGNEKAVRYGIPFQLIERKNFQNLEEFSSSIFQTISEKNIDLICLGGFLQKLRIPQEYENRIMNIHPSLLPAFGGKGMYGHHVHEAVIHHGVKITGCTVHFVNNEYDQGPIIIQRAVPVSDNDTADSLARKVFHEECIAYPEAIKAYANQDLKIIGRKVIRVSS